MRNIELFNTKLLVNDSLCLENPNTSFRVNPALRLYVKVTDNCSAKCEFCANEDCKNFGKLDLDKLKYIITYLKEQNVLHGISLTGGEPMMNPSLVNDILNLAWDIDNDLEIAISTNGYNLREFAKFDQINKLESIHISRHHYDDEVNKAIFKSNSIASTEDIIYLQDRLDDKKIININTLIMKNYIDNLKEIKNMLNYVGNVNVYKDGFVSLMKVNDFSEKHFINFNEIFNNLDNNFFTAHHFYNKKYCECLDGMYITDNNKIVEYYARMVKDVKDNGVTKQLVYTSDNKVTAGFSNKILFE